MKETKVVGLQIGDKKSNVFIRIGIITILCSLLLVLFVFGLTFGTIFLSAIGVLISSWGVLVKLSKTNRYKTKVLYI